MTLVDVTALEAASHDQLLEAAAVMLHAAATHADTTHNAASTDQEEETPSSVGVVIGCQQVLAALAPPQGQIEGIDRLQALEAVKSTAAASQAHTTAVVEQLRHNDDALRGVAKSRWGSGLAAEIGLARGDSPARGAKHLGLAVALTRDLPNTFHALRMGRIHEEHAQKIATETAWLSAEHRRTVDEMINDRLGSVGPRQLAAVVRGHAQALDQPGAVKHLAKARTQRRVTIRPAPEGMAYLQALLPMQQGVAVYASLTKGATSIVGTDDAADPEDPEKVRTRDQLMADLLVARATGQATAPAVPVEVQLLMTDTALFGKGQQPGWLAGHGPIPADMARHWIANPDAEVFLRRLFTRPTDGQFAAMEARGRDFPDRIRHMVIARDGVCRTPFCDAPIREIDHIIPARDGGPTSMDNASGLCAACNQTKETTGWSHRGNPVGLTVTTPTGHDYTVTTPHLTEPIAAPPDPKAPPDTGSADDPDDSKPDTCAFRHSTHDISLRIAA